MRLISWTLQSGSEQLLRLLKQVNLKAVLQRKGMEIAMFLPIATGQFCLLSYQLIAGVWASPSGFPIPFKNCLKAFQ